MIIIENYCIKCNLFICYFLLFFVPSPVSPSRATACTEGSGVRGSRAASGATSRGTSRCDSVGIFWNALASFRGYFRQRPRAWPCWPCGCVPRGQRLGTLQRNRHAVRRRPLFSIPSYPFSFFTASWYFSSKTASTWSRNAFVIGKTELLGSPSSPVVGCNGYGYDM